MLSWAPAPFEVALRPMTQLRPMMKPILPFARGDLRVAGRSNPQQ